MLRFLIRRTLSGVLVMWLVTTIVFLLFFATSRDPAARFAGKSATPATLALLRHRMGLDEPLPLQYWHFVTRLLSGDLGYSYATRSSVGGLIESALPVSVSLVCGAAALWLAAGVVTGVIGATRMRSVVDRGITLLVVVGMSVPVFVTAATLLYVLAFRLPVFPLGGYVPLRSDPAEWFYHLVLPWITGALLQSAVYTRLTRGSLLDVLGEDYVRTARAKGLSERRVVLPPRPAGGADAGRHAVRRGFRGGDERRRGHRDRLRPAGDGRAHRPVDDRRRPAGHHGRRAARRLGHRGRQHPRRRRLRPSRPPRTSDLTSAAYVSPDVHPREQHPSSQVSGALTARIGTLSPWPHKTLRTSRTCVVCGI
jgi:peptide/nickel transport system permease protein